MQRSVTTPSNTAAPAIFGNSCAATAQIAANTSIAQLQTQVHSNEIMLPQLQVPNKKLSKNLYHLLAHLLLNSYLTFFYHFLLFFTIFTGK